MYMNRPTFDEAMSKKSLHSRSLWSSTVWSQSPPPVFRGDSPTSRNDMGPIDRQTDSAQHLSCCYRLDTGKGRSVAPLWPRLTARLQTEVCRWKVVICPELIDPSGLLFYWWCFFNQPQDLRALSADRRETLHNDQYMRQLFNASPKIKGVLPWKIFTPAKFWIDFTQLLTFIANISGRSQAIQNRTDVWVVTIFKPPGTVVPEGCLVVDRAICWRDS